MTQYICTACRVRFNSHQPLSFACCGRCGRTSTTCRRLQPLNLHPVTLPSLTVKCSKLILSATPPGLPMTPDP